MNIQEIKAKLASYMEHAAEWSVNAQAAQGRLDRDIAKVRRKFKALEVSEKKISERWLQGLLVGVGSVFRPPRVAEKLAKWGAALEMLRPLQRVSLALNAERHEFAALINSCEKTLEFFKESQERLEKFQALVASFPDDRTFAERLRQEAALVERRKVELGGQLSRMARLLADARKRNLVRS